jgi:hypothetical protein
MRQAANRLATEFPGKRAIVKNSLSRIDNSVYTYHDCAERIADTRTRWDWRASERRRARILSDQSSR